LMSYFKLFVLSEYMHELTVINKNQKRYLNKCIPWLLSFVWSMTMMMMMMGKSHQF
jgi:hypothetical protein